MTVSLVHFLVSLSASLLHLVKRLGKAVFVHRHVGNLFQRFFSGFLQVACFADLHDADHAHAFMGIAGIKINTLFFQLHPEFLVEGTFPGLCTRGNKQAAAVMSSAD